MDVSIDGIAVAVTPGETVLDAAKRAGRWVPTLCFDDRMAPFGACRVCLVGVEGAPAPLPACTTLCRDGMVVETAEERARRIARNVVESVLSELPEPPAEHTELAAIARESGSESRAGPARRTRLGTTRAIPISSSSTRSASGASRCVRACDEIQGAFALTATGRGFHTNVTAGLDAGFKDSSCVSCGACADTCPTDAITERLLVGLADEGVS